MKYNNTIHRKWKGAAMIKEYDEQIIRVNYAKLTRLLIDKGMSITTMESATSGQVASLITDTEGASAIMKGAYITYSNEAKIKNGVPAETIEKYSVWRKYADRLIMRI